MKIEGGLEPIEGGKEMESEGQLGHVTEGGREVSGEEGV